MSVNFYWDFYGLWIRLEGLLAANYEYHPNSGLVPHLNDNSKPYLDQENLDDIIVYSHSLEVWNPEYSVARVAGKEAVRERVLGLKCYFLAIGDQVTT
ncbi:hypothetical protein CTI12_AA538920 [Artemisia annua]|uniref:Uncharacterized protein n=1 Tax=Artemisia annua TaxID=35608 RepID=A0A2U1L260_ARTAN|nr:hypothetical protein CTI12_AA538920 [Artemisia annua]